MSILFKLIIIVIVTEAITELIVNSEIFDPFRKWLFTGRKIRKFFHRALDCFYCTSVWVSFITSFFISLSLFSTYIEWFIIWMVVHRTTDILNKMIYKIDF